MINGAPFVMIIGMTMLLLLSVKCWDIHLMVREVHNERCITNV